MLKTILIFSVTTFNIFTLLYYTLWFSNILCVINRKKIELIQLLSIIFLLILYCGNSFNGDYWAYYKRYEAMDMHEFELGFRTIGEFCKSINLHYNVFISLLIIPLYIGLIKFFRKTSNFLHLFYALYFTMLFFYDVGQVRNFIISVLITFAIVCLMKKKRGYAFFFIVIASFFHHLSLVYVLLLFIRPKKIVKYRLFIYIFTFVLCFYLYANGNKIPFLSTILYAITKDSGKLVYGTQRMRLGFVIPITLHLLNAGLVYFSVKLIKEKGNTIIAKHRELIMWSKALVIVGYLTFPLIMVDLSFDRIVRNFSFIFFSLGCVALQPLTKKTARKKRRLERYFFFFLFVYVVLWDIGMPIRYGTLPPEKYRILHNNFLLQEEDKFNGVDVKPFK